MLQRHFFAVAFHGAKNILRSKDGKQKFKRSYHMIGDAVKIISPLLLAEKPGWGMKELLQMANKVFNFYEAAS